MYSIWTYDSLSFDMKLSLIKDVIRKHFHNITLKLKTEQKRDESKLKEILSKEKLQKNGCVFEKLYQKSFI